VPECHAWTYVRSISRCLLKGAGGFTANASNDRVSGRVARAGAPPSPSPPPPAPAPAVGAAADYPPRLTPAPKAGPFTKAHYGEVLGLSWRFYEAQRSGPLPAGYRVPWRKPSHLADRVVGGWYDAGDYLKLNFVLASSVASLAWGVLEFEGAYAASGQLAHARTNLFAAADYLERCRIGARQYVGQIGHPDIDHDFWGRAEQSAGARPAFVYDASKPAPDLMGKVAAALAASSLVFRPTNATFAAKLLSTARELYAWGAEKPGKYSDYYTTATASIYKSSAWEDDMAWGAYWLHRATGSAAYLEDAHKYWKAKDWGVEPSWDDSGAAVGVAMAALADDGAAVPGAAAFKDYARNRFLRAWAKADGFEQIVKTPGGLVRPSWNKWGNLAMSTSAALVALVQAKHTREPALRAAALQFGRRQVDYALGAGGGRSFVVGWGHNPPLRAHHAGASCPNRPASCDWAHFSAKAPNPQVLYGALVGGPAGPGDATYKDERDDYVTNEVANDYNAGFTGALAGVYELSA
jgi:endoglucanase